MNIYSQFAKQENLSLAYLHIHAFIPISILS